MYLGNPSLRPPNFFVEVNPENFFEEGDRAGLRAVQVVVLHDAESVLNDALQTSSARNESSASLTRAAISL